MADNDLFQAIPEHIDGDTMSAIDGLNADTAAKRAVHDAATAYMEAKLEAVSDHLTSLYAIERAEVEYVHPRANGPALTIIPTAESDLRAIIGEVEEIGCVEVIHEVGRWLTIA